MKMRKIVKVLLVLVLMNLMLVGCTKKVDVPCEGASDETILKISGMGFDYDFSYCEISEAMQQETFTTENINSDEEVNEFEVTGFSLKTLLEANHIEFEDVESIVMTASDGYVMTAPNSEFAENDLYILNNINGDKLETPTSCIPNRRSMYWVRDLVSVELVESKENEDLVNVTADEVQFFFENAKSLETQELSYYNEDYDFYSLEEYFDNFVGEVPTSAVKMIASDGFEKSEPEDVFISCFVSELDDDNENGPVYYSEEIKEGMQVKQLAYVLADNIALYFGEEASVQDILETTGLSGADEYIVKAIDGFELVVPGDAIEFGKIEKNEDEGYLQVSFDGIEWDGKKGGGVVRNVSSIRVSGSDHEEDKTLSDNNEMLVKCFIGDERVSMSEEDFMNLPQVEVELSRTDSKGNHFNGVYKGVHWSDLASYLGVDENSSVTFVASDGYEITHQGDILLDPNSLIALYENGEYIESEGNGRIWFCGSESFTANNWAKYVEKIVIE